MASVPRKLFSWDQVEPLGDLKRLQLVLDNLGDEALVSALERERGQGRDDYPLRGLWNSILAGVVFQHASVESLRRELLQNGQLRWLCGEGKVPPVSVYSRFLHAVFTHDDQIDALFEGLVQELVAVLPGFREQLALDSKGIRSLAKRAAREGAADGRRDGDADYGKKAYRGKREDGTSWKRGLEVVRLQAAPDRRQHLRTACGLFGDDGLHRRRQRRQGAARADEEVPAGCARSGQVLTADKGGDDTNLTVLLWQEHRIQPVIAIRCWKDGEQSRLLPGQGSVVYDQQGAISCFCPVTGVQRRMRSGGFEKDRGTLKKLCPAKHRGLTCEGCHVCPVASGLRVPMDIDRRIFTPVDRQSYQ